MPYPRAPRRIRLRRRPARALGLCLAVVGGATLAGGAAYAEAAASGSIEISAAAPERGPAPTAGRTLVDAEAIAASGATTLGEALAAVPGLSLSEAGPAGSQAAISLRGSTTNQVLVLVDGVPVSDPATGLTDLAKLGLDPSDLDSIEVVQGGASAQYGPDAVGGVVLLRTKAARPDRAVLGVAFSNLLRVPYAAVSGTGSAAVAIDPSLLSLVDGQEASLSLGLPGGLRLRVGAEREANAFLYRDSSGVKRRRDNADLLAASLGASWEGLVGSGQARASLSASARDLGVPGTVSSPTPEAREVDGRVQGGLTWATDVFGSDRLAFTASLFGLHGVTSYREDGSQAADLNRSSRAGLEGRWSLLATKSLSLGFGTALRYEVLDSTVVTTASGGLPQRLSAGLHLEPTWSLGAWTLSTALRYDYTSDYASGFSASLGAARRLGGGLTASANASTAYRAPSFDDLYWPLASGCEGNPDLEPETSYSLDLGLDAPGGPLAWTATAFLRYVEGVILWQPGADSVWRPSNYGDALYPGLELKAALDAGRGLSLSLSWTYLHSYVLSGGLSLADDLRVPMVPEQSLDLGLAWRGGGVRAGLDLAYTGLRYYKTANVAYDPAHLVAGAHLRLPLGRDLALTARADNLLDERYESVQGYPMPGFSLRLGIEAGSAR